MRSIAWKQAECYLTANKHNRKKNGSALGCERFIVPPQNTVNNSNKKSPSYFWVMAVKLYSPIDMVIMM